MSNSSIKKIVGLILLIILAVPYQTEYTPEWRIQIVDKKGNATVNIVVKQEYYYINFISKKQELRNSDKNGYVVFPARTFTCPLICRIPVAALNIISSIPHGPKMWGGATVVEQETYVFSRYVNGKSGKSEMKDKLILQR